MHRTFFSRSLGLGKSIYPCANYNSVRRLSITVPRRANTLMETSGFSETQLEVRDAISKICSNFPDVSSHYHEWQHILSVFAGVLGSTRRVGRVSTRASCCAGERWLDWNCLAGRSWWIWAGNLGSNYDATYYFRVCVPLSALKFGH